jgi:pyruvate dehydrogenase E2 component (dihydrolipoamide acetyltransferase)
VITTLHVTVGDSLTTGDPIVTVRPSEGATSETVTDEESGTPSIEPEPQPEPEPETPRVEDRAQISEPVPKPRATEPVQRPAGFAERNSENSAPVPAAPTVRRFAREIGVDITGVEGSGPGGRISIDDVKAFANRILTGAPAAAEPATTAELPDFEIWGPVRREPMTKVRKLTAANLARAWATVPQVTNHDVADITALEEARKRYRSRVEDAGGKLTVTSILVKVVATALRSFPNLGASVDSAREEIVFKDSAHIGVAVDTDRGLLVPVIRDADTKNITTISVELDDLARRARDRKLTPDEMRGAVFSISNLGGIGGTGFSPIVNWPEVAILGVSRGSMEPRWNGSEFVPRLMLPLSLSYDHRLVDGAEAARFLRWLAEVLEQPLLLALEG